MRRSHQLWFIGWFLAVIYVVPLSQAGRELSRGRRPQFLDVLNRAPSAANLRGYERQLEESSLWARAVRPFVQSVWLKLDDAGEKVIVGLGGWLFYRPDARYLVEPPADGEDPAAAIVDFRDQLERRGARLIVVPVPGKPAVYPEKLTRRARQPASPTVPMIGRLRDSGIEVLNLFDLFRRDAGAAHYLPKDTHWTGQAARLAAEATARRIRELGWIVPGSTEYTVRAVRVQRVSDIARMIGRPDIEHVRCEQVVHAGTGEPYRDDPDSPVLVLGDSFLRMYQTDAPRAAGFIAHLARDLRMPVASVVNDGGASTLVRQELSRRPALLAGKRLVVWEFVERDLRFGAEGWKLVRLPPATPAPSRNP